MLCSGWTGKRVTGLQQRQPGSDFTPYRAGYLVGEGPGRGGLQGDAVSGAGREPRRVLSGGRVIQSPSQAGRQVHQADCQVMT